MITYPAKTFRPPAPTYTSFRVLEDYMYIVGSSKPALLMNSIYNVGWAPQS